MGMIEYSEEVIMGQIISVPFNMPMEPEGSSLYRRHKALQNACLADKLVDASTGAGNTLKALIAQRSAELSAFWAEYWLSQEMKHGRSN